MIICRESVFPKWAATCFFFLWSEGSMAGHDGWLVMDKAGPGLASEPWGGHDLIPGQAHLSGHGLAWAWRFREHIYLLQVASGCSIYKHIAGCGAKPNHGSTRTPPAHSDPHALRDEVRPIGRPAHPFQRLDRPTTPFDRCPYTSHDWLAPVHTQIGPVAWSVSLFNVGSNDSPG